MIFVGEIMEEKDVELEDVTKKFGDFVAVDDISFSVKKSMRAPYLTYVVRCLYVCHVNKHHR